MMIFSYLSAHTSARLPSSAFVSLERNTFSLLSDLCLKTHYIRLWKLQQWNHVPPDPLVLVGLLLIKSTLPFLQTIHLVLVNPGSALKKTLIYEVLSPHQVTAENIRFKKVFCRSPSVLVIPGLQASLRPPEKMKLFRKWCKIIYKPNEVWKIYSQQNK